ncbi:hypothetical protein ACJMK2_027940, partial [Sinanodonta woodiana]
MKCRKCELDLCEGHEFCYECGTDFVETIVILCSGRRKDGSLCGAELQEKYKYCAKCGTRVDQSFFQKKQTQCSFLKRDGSSCGNLLNDADDFCLECGTQRGTASTASGNTVLFSSDAKNDGGNFDGMKTKQTSAIGSEISSATKVQGNSLVFGMTSQLDGEIRKEDYALFQDTSMEGNSTVLESHVDKENTEHSPSSGSSDPFSINDLKDEEANYVYNGKSASRNSVDLENNLSIVTLSEQKDDDFIEDHSDDNGENTCNDDSSPDSADSELPEDEVTMPASQECVAASEQIMASSKHKKKKKHHMKRDRKKKKMENMKKRSDESSEQLQEHKIKMEICENSRSDGQPARPQVSDLQLLQESIMADGSSAMFVGLVGASLSQKEEDDGISSTQRKQNGDEATASDVDEMSREGINEDHVVDRNTNHDQAPIQESGISQDPHSSVSNLKKSYAQIVETGQNQHGDILNIDPNKNEVENEIPGQNPEMDRKALKDAENNQQNSKGPELSKDEENKKSSTNDCFQNTSSRRVPAEGKGSGNHASQRTNSESVMVYFHALLSPEFDLTPSDVVMIQFRDDFSGWDSNRYISSFVRKTDDHYTEFCLELEIPQKAIFKDKKMQYKYVIIKDKSMKNKDDKHIWEYYHADGQCHTNRSLHLPDRMKNMVKWHQYDGVVFPKWNEGFLDRVKSMLPEKAKKYLSGEIKEREKEDFFQSLQYFMPKFFKDLQTEQLPAMPVDEALTQLDDLLYALRRVYIIDRRCYKHIPEFEQKISDFILAPVLRLFEKVPLYNWKESPAESEIRMLRATVAVFVQTFFYQEMKLEQKELLAQGLLVRPNHETRICHDLDWVNKSFPQVKKRQLSGHLISFINSMSTVKSPAIFCCIPLHHFLTNALHPFDKIPEDYSHDHKSPKWWGVAALSESVGRFKNIPSSKWTVKLEEVVSLLYPQFEMDYLLPRTFMAMLNLDEIGDAIKTGKIPIEICAASLTYYVKITLPTLPGSPPTYEEKKVCDAVLELEKLCRAVKITTDESSRPDLIQPWMVYRIASDLLKETLRSRFKLLVSGAVQIFIHAVTIYDQIHQSQKLEQPNTRQQSEHFTVLSRLYDVVKLWLEYLHRWDLYPEDNLKFWDSIFAPVDLQSEAVRDAWNFQAENDLHDTLQKRMQYYTFVTWLIDIYCRKVDTFHPSVQNCLSRLAFKAIETGYTIQMFQLLDHERERFGGLLSSLFTRGWDAAVHNGEEENRIILHHILNWTPFAYFFKMIFGDESNQRLLSPVCFKRLKQVSCLVKQGVRALANGTITLSDLVVIKAAEDKFQELVSIIPETSEDKKWKTLNIAKAVNIRCREVESYLTQKTHITTLVHLCQNIQSVQLNELDRTMKHLEGKTDLCIKDICLPANVETTLDGFHPQITAFKLSAEVICMLEPLHASFKSNIFLSLWREVGYASKVTTIEDVYEKVWKPVSSKMEEITRKIFSGEILFNEIELYIGRNDKEEKMVEEIRLINLSDEIARERVKQFELYRQLEASVEGAKTILNVAIEYELSGDFKVIETIASQENAANKMMKEFDDSLLQICKFLEDLTPEKIKCLDEFINCKRLVLWLRKSMTEGLKELRVFVDLASRSAGEGAMEIDKVNCLHAATTGYAPLIFDLAEASGYRELLDKCKILWRDLKADPNLPRKLHDTNRNLEWLKTVKQAHGSVEVTSLAQAKAISSKGIFRVGALNTIKNITKGMDLQNTPQLTVPDHGSESPDHKQYTFEQLLDLQSRLMLVAGRAEQGNDDVDKFMLVFDSLRRLANVFIKLNSAGCILFKHWHTKFLCDPTRPVCAFIEFGQGAKSLKGRRTKTDDVTAVIPKIARFMENCLEKWIDHINQKRSEYLELNYFTTDQLVILQQELVKVGPGQITDIKIYPLLSAVKENCTYEDLVDAMRKASDDMEVVQTEVDEEHRETENGESGEAALNETKKERIQKFIAEMVKSGYSEKLAKVALGHVDPDQITEGIIWCNDHLEEVAAFKEEDAKMVLGEHPSKEAKIYEGWKKSCHSSMSLTAAIINRLEVAEGNMDVDPLIDDLEKLWEEFLTSVSSSVTDYLSVEHLGLILRRLAEKDHRKIDRPFPSSFQPGTPNLIICPKADVLSTVLSIYMMDQNQPLPYADEVLMCTRQTTLDQLDAFWRRTVANTSRKIYCLVNSDLLDFDVSDRGERRLEYYMHQAKHQDFQYRLIVVCSAENEYKSRIITALDRFRRPPLPIPDICHIVDYVKRKLKVKGENTASSVDFDSSSVRVVRSWRAGVGKSLYVKRRNEKLAQENPSYKMTDLVKIPLQEKEINVSDVTEILLTHILPPGVTTPRIFHLDIAHEVQEGVDFFLFNLLILGCLTDKSGYVWRRSPRDLYLIETMPIGQSVSYIHHVFDFLPFITCRSPLECLDILTRRLKPKDFKEEDPQFDLEEFTGQTFQRPYQYLSCFDQRQRFDDVDASVPWGTPADCLKVLLRHCGVPDPSWAEFHHFVWFLNTQLRDFEKSSFCSASVAEDLPGFSMFVLKFLIQMSRDFSTRSLLMSEESPTTMMGLDQEDEEEMEDSDEEGEEGLAQYQMRRTWESSPHPYLFFNPDGHTITFLGFNIERSTGNLIDQQTGRVLETAIMPKKLYYCLVRNRVPIKEDFDSLPRERKIERLCRVMGNDKPHDPDKTYELTTDNVKKILAIYMRFRCDIPVIIMGETGCGKTRLVKFMCALQTPPRTKVKNMILMKVHGGTTNADIKRKVEEAMKTAQQNTDKYGPHMYTVLFFDEANTTESIGMIKEIMCDRSMEGNHLDKCQNLKFVAACNPYKKHSEALIKRLEQAGLGYHVDANKTTDRLGRVPLRRLVYRVQPLPQSLLPLVWDFGQLNTQTENLYIRQMVRRYIRNERLPNIPGLVKVISGVLTASQDFMRQQKDECSFVSLRDVERVLNVMSWLYAQSQEERTLFDMMDEIKPFYSDDEGNIEKESADEAEKMLNAQVRNQDHDVTRSLVLALGVCYHACLKNREEYRRHVAPFFRAPCNLPRGPDQIEQEISVCQDVFLENVQLEKNIARNTALKENVFMMVISIELRIPLFLVGKPGSSKSLAKTIVSDAMQGNAAHKDLFTEFKQVHMVSFQCSPLSTPDGIMGTFRQCAQFQKDKDLDRFVSVVVLDEVGLAEDSPRMPLKTLHPLLEDGCQGDEKPQPHKKVAFIGISNWALDPAKMNRGILVQREVPDLEELVNTAEGICGTMNHVYQHVQAFIEPMAISYLELFGEASVKREFFGLRDFYSLMKMIYSFVEQTNKPPTWHQLLHSIKRNFGGLDTINPVEAFAKRLNMVDRNAELREGDPDCKTASLIKACLYDVNNTQSESRYLLLLTENYGALTILQQLIPTNNIITIFGSSFPSDQEYTQVCRNINRIKVCMETGKTVVLLNLENLYESLYDALNQYYVYFGGERYVDLGLGTHRVKCRVHKKFRLIVVAEKDVVYKKFPIPLINRLEKHFLTVNTILTREQSQLAEELEKWVKDFCTESTKSIFMQRSEKSKSTCSVGEVFMGYHADTCSSIILHVWQRLQTSEQTPRHDKKEILDEAKKLLLWCATPDSVVRLERCNLAQQEKIKMKQVYLREQFHENLAQYLHFKLETEKIHELFAQITTHSKLLSTADKSDIHQAVGIPPERIALETLQSFDTEQQFSRKIRYLLESNPEEELLLMIQCDSGDTSANLVASARYCVLDEHQHIKNRRTAPCHVIFIIQLSRIAGGCFTGFQCGLWHSAHVDDLRAQDEEMPSIMEMLGKSVGTLMERAVGTKPTYTADMEEMLSANTFDFGSLALETNDMDTKRKNPEVPRQVETKEMDWNGEVAGKHLGDPELQDDSNERADQKLNVRSLILSCIQPALVMVKDKEETSDRSTRRIELMLDLLHQKPIDDLPTFLHGLSCNIAALLKEKEKSSFRAEFWMSNEAAKPENINKAGTFRRACLQYLESKISPILAGIIAHIDTNHNLDIIHSHITSGDWKARLWLQILSTPGAIQLQYSDLQSPTRLHELNEVIIKTTGCEGQMFTAVMPFSWLIYEQIDGIWKTAQGDQEEEDVHMQMERVIGLLAETKLGPLLETLEGEVSSDDICYLYAEDFTYMVYHAQSPDEHELVHKAIMQTSAILLEDTSPSILAKLVSIHENHNKIVQHLRYFRSINQVWPECAAAIRTMREENPNHFLLASDQFTLAVLGLHLLMEQLEPPNAQYLNNADSHQEWLRKICNYRPVIEKGLALYSSDSGTRVDRAVVHAKEMWTRITVVKLCIEHMMTSDKEAEKHGLKNVMPLWMMLGDSPDLKELQSLENVEKFLKMCNRAAMKELLGQEQTCSYCEDNIEGAPVVLPCKDIICIKCYHEVEALGTKKCPKCSKDIPNKFNPEATGNERKAVQKFKEYQSRCNSFFMDVVTQLCFADNTVPSDQVVDKLLGYITMTAPTERQGKMKTRKLTKELTIFNDCVDPNPVFRSFLLQLLLRTSEKKVLSNLEKYFSQAHVVIGEDNIDIETHMVQLWQLVVKCLEDSFYLDCTKEDEVALATGHLIDAEYDIKKTSPSMLQRLYGIAKARFGLAITAKHIHETVLKKGQSITQQQRRLIDHAASLCEGDCKWPKIYFIKYLCRCYGVDSYQAMCKNNVVRYLRWIKYQPVEERDKVREVSDRYIVCGPHYVNIREAVTKVVLGEGTDQLDKAMKDTRVPENKKEILLCLALHREVTMSRLQKEHKIKATPEAIDMLQKYCSEADFMKNKEVAQKILQNAYGVRSHILTVTPDLDLKQQGVLCLLMHCDLVLRNLQGDRTLAEPLIRLATRPQTMKDAFIPTMPQDDVQEIREVLLVYRGNDNPVFYRCPNGHPYIIGECGRPYTVSKCPKCGSEIGGQSHVPLPGNVPDSGVDCTETGHILGHAKNRTQLGPERSLTAAYCGIIRLMTHITMLLGANIDSLAVTKFIKPDITEDTVPQFLWQHIEHDLVDLHRTLGKSLDDVFVIMHSILSSMVERHRDNERIGKEMCELTSKVARSDWEKKFSEKFVVPTLQKMENLLIECNTQLVKDKRLGSDPLLCLLYEINQPQEKTHFEMLQENPAMWRFRAQITMDHLHHEFDVRIMGTKKTQMQHPVLELFLKEDHHLRAIRYLPSILKLQRILFQKYQRKLDRAEASTITVETLRKESDRDELPKLLDEYAEVWDLVRENLVFVPKEYRRRRIDVSTPVSQLLPTASDAGQCAYSVLEFLFRKQNDFLDNYYQKAKRRVAEIPHVKVRDITPAHLISYHPEQDILPLVLANCNYSFEVGKGTTIEYNFANLERQIVDRFLFGKCFIDIEIELMVYRAEYTNATVFRKLQEKIPQESLSIGVKHKISEEFRSLPDLCQALDNLDIAISFLKSIGGNPGNNIDKFMVETLKMKQSLYSSKAKQICQYQHAKSLWLLLSLEKTKQLALHKQVIFDGLPEQFHQQLSAELVQQVMAYLQPLALERLGLLLDLMFECIILVISLPQNPDDEDYVDAKEKNLFVHCVRDDNKRLYITFFKEISQL